MHRCAEQKHCALNLCLSIFSAPIAAATVGAQRLFWQQALCRDRQCPSASTCRIVQDTTEWMWQSAGLERQAKDTQGSASRMLEIMNARA